MKWRVNDGGPHEEGDYYAHTCAPYRLSTAIIIDYQRAKDSDRFPVIAGPIVEPAPLVEFTLPDGWRCYGPCKNYDRNWEIDAAHSANGSKVEYKLTITADSPEEAVADLLSAIDRLAK